MVDPIISQTGFVKITKIGCCVIAHRYFPNVTQIKLGREEGNRNRKEWMLLLMLPSAREFSNFTELVSFDVIKI